MSPSAALLSMLIFLHLLPVLWWLQEVAKNAKHLAIVDKAGGDFIPLIAECFGDLDIFCFYSSFILLPIVPSPVVVFHPEEI